MIKLKRNEKGVAILDTKSERIKMVLGLILGVISAIAVTVSFAWLPYWILTGKNMYSTLLVDYN